MASVPERRGFTLLEVIVAVVIVSSALVGWLATYGAELRTLSQARIVAIAVELAEDRITAIELNASDRLPALPDSLEGGTFSAPFSDYTWTAQSQSVPGTNLAEVTVRVNGPGAGHELTTVLPLRSLRRLRP